MQSQITTRLSQALTTSKQKLQLLDAGKLKSVGEKGAVFVLQKPHDCLYIPAGHVVLEFASDAPMVYGLRKLLLVRGERDHLNYGRLVEAYVHAKKDVTKM